MMEEIGSRKQHTGNRRGCPYRKDEKQHPPSELATDCASQAGLKKADQPADVNHRMGKPARITEKPVEDDGGGDYVDQVVVQGETPQTRFHGIAMTSVDSQYGFSTAQTTAPMPIRLPGWAVLKAAMPDRSRRDGLVVSLNSNG